MVPFMEHVKGPKIVQDPGDDELILRVQGGDRVSYDLLVKRYQRRIYFLALRMARDHDVADDIAQETFVRAWFAIGSFEIGRNFYTWIYRICMNLSINHLKRRRFAVAASQMSDETDPLEREAGGASPYDAMVSEEMTSRIESAIESLSPKYKAVLVLRVYENMSYEDIARTLEISVGTVMSRLFRAREKIREALEEDER
jgi:RNA polymerase sigma-70 factor (ECF subfamily)